MDLVPGWGHQSYRMMAVCQVTTMQSLAYAVSSLQLTVEDQFAELEGRMQAEVTGLVEGAEEGSSSGESSDHPSIDQTEYCESPVGFERTVDTLPFPYSGDFAEDEEIP